jgi:sugar phosphate permease
LADLSMHHFKDLYRYRWVMLAIMGVIYFLACLHRVAPTVIARDLMLEFGADATALGLMSSAYFYLYAAIQPSVGVLSDTMGPRRVITIFTLIATAGTVLFGTADNMPLAAVGRGLIGIGAGGIFVPGLKIFSRWYRAKEFAGVTGIFLAMGNAGNLSASLPLTYLVLFLGWHLSFIGIGAFSLLLAAVSWMVLRDRPEDKGWNDSLISGDDPSPPSEPTPHGMTFHKRFRIVLGHPSFWMITLSYFFFGGPALTFQGLWAVPYLMDIHGFSRVEAGGLLMLMPIGLIVGAPCIGYLADRFPMGRTRILTISLCLPLLCWLFLLVSGGKSNFIFLPPIFFVMGLCGGGSLSLYMTMLKELFPSWLTGTAMGLMNPAAFLAGALFQPFTGYLMDVVGSSGSIYPLEAYHRVFGVFLVSTIVALGFLIFLMVRQTRQQEI